MHYMRNGMFSIKTPQGTQLRLITSSIAIKQQWLTLDHWVCPLSNSLKDSGGFKRNNRLKKQNETIKKIIAPFYGWSSTTSRLEPLWGGHLFYNTKLPKIPGNHFINLRTRKDWVDLRAPQWFWPWDSWVGNPAPSPLDHWG